VAFLRASWNILENYEFIAGTMGDAVPRAWRSWPEDVRIPVARPRLPAASDVMPYLERIDASRWYSNGGPLVCELEARIAQRFGVSSSRVALVANATIGLTLALEALEVPRGTLCMMPAWTFAASAHAALAAGLIPWFVDVDERTWSLTPALARNFLREAPGTVGAIMPVAPFGYPVDAEGWDELDAAEECAVVVDGAAAFDSARACSRAVVVSLHATKVLSAGEGGFVVCRDAETAVGIKARANFGFSGSREACINATNAKLSEYAAAVALASLDGWERRRAGFRRVAQEYAAALHGIPGVALQPGYGDEWVSATTNVSLPNGCIEPLEDALSAGGFGHRRWWGDGLTAHRAFSNCPRTRTAVTERLSATVLGVPCWEDLPNDAIVRIGETVREVCGR